VGEKNSNVNNVIVRLDYFTQMARSVWLDEPSPHKIAGCWLAGANPLQYCTVDDIHIAEDLDPLAHCHGTGRESFTVLGWF
jgi:hypothetical protein